MGWTGLLLQLLLVSCLAWAVCGLLTAADLLPEGSSARTDSSGSLIHNSPWFRVPYPGQSFSLVGELWRKYSMVGEKDEDR